jgi:ornithine carbamoyltransferase
VLTSIPRLRSRHFLSLRDLSAAEITALLDLAVRTKANPAGLRAGAPLTGRTLGMIFQKPSLRTRVSFETGMTRMGGHAIYLSPVDFDLGKRESIEDVARVMSGYVDAIMARVFAHAIVEELARHSRVPVINGLSDFEHPCQILADLLTLRERRGRLAGLRGAYIGDGNNVAHSLLLGCALMGMHFVVACPRGYEPDAGLLRDAQAIAHAAGGSVGVLHELAAAAKDADFLYTDVWASMGQESEAAERREKFRGYQINADLMACARPDAVILHCLPAHYGDEIDYATSRTPNSAIFEQAENRMHAQNALLLALLDRPGNPTG